MTGCRLTDLPRVTLPTPIDMLGRHGWMCFGQILWRHTAILLGYGLVCSFAFTVLGTGNDSDPFLGAVNRPAGIRDCLIDKATDKRYNHAGYEYRYVSKHRSIPRF